MIQATTTLTRADPQVLLFIGNKKVLGRGIGCPLGAHVDRGL